MIQPEARVGWIEGRGVPTGAEVESARMNSETMISGFFEQVAQATARVLMLDYDGTLAPFRVDPDQAVPYPEIVALLERIRAQGGTRMIMVTGRRASDIVRLLNMPNLEVWGCHGLEHLSPNGDYELSNLSEQGLQAISEADELLTAEGISDLAEFKPAGIAIHWRGREEIASDVRDKVWRVWSMLPHRDGLRLASFDGGMEIRVDTRDKGDVVKTVLAEMGAGAAAAYMGDDVTDEDAFAAIKGHGLGVLVRDEYRFTLADAWVRPPEGVIGFLENWIIACGGAI